MSKTPNHTPKPREFWIRPARPSLPFGACVDEPTMGGIHVIEYSALDHMAECFRVEQDKRLKAEKQLEQATAEIAEHKQHAKDCQHEMRMLMVRNDELRAEVEQAKIYTCPACGEQTCDDKAMDILIANDKVRTACLDLASALEEMAKSKDDGNAEGAYGTVAHEALVKHQPLLQKLKEETK